MAVSEASVVIDRVAWRIWWMRRVDDEGGFGDGMFDLVDGGEHL